VSGARWFDGPLIGFDTETSDKDHMSARIVTAAVVTPDAPAVEWLAAVEVDIAAEAQAKHGISVEKARAEGEPSKLVVDQVIEALYLELRAGAGLVVMNAPFDLTLLDAEAVRYGVPTLAERLGHPVRPVIDPLALDRMFDKWRKGSRKLEDLAALYGVELTDAHTAGADALAALEVAVGIGRRYPQARCTAQEMHDKQAAWYPAWAADFQEFRRRTDPTAVIDGQWPVRALTPEVAS
jgi:DNA polymerase-3 subunit epsilon